MKILGGVKLYPILGSVRRNRHVLIRGRKQLNLPSFNLKFENNRDFMIAGQFNVYLGHPTHKPIKSPLWWDYWDAGTDLEDLLNESN